MKGQLPVWRTVPCCLPRWASAGRGLLSHYQCNEFWVMSAICHCMISHN